MQNIELLAPAGSMEALIAAVQNGCDAVYLGGTMFGARAFANNFNDSEMIDALQYAHAYGVKVYVTMNTLIFEEEMEPAVQYAEFLYKQGVDALILQDLGLFDLLHQRFPDLELHASTQMHIHNQEGIQLLRNAGMKRIVLPRETPIEEIMSYTKLGIDIEVFVQGALCISYSGQCLMSAKKLSRSGNRGACAQMCRMKYRLGRLDDGTVTYVDHEGAYLLSPKDLNTLDHVPELIDAGITSFKIEGRMKRPAYVAQMVSLYRKAIDAYLRGERFHQSEAKEEMEKIFNRGFTSGHLFHRRGSALINSHRPNHMGIEIGTVLAKKGRNVKIRLSRSLAQYDGIRFLCEGEDIGCMVNKLYIDGLLVNGGKPGQIVEVEVDGFIPKQTKVVKTSDVKQIETLQKDYEKGMRKVPVYMDLILTIGEPAHLSVWDDLGNLIEENSIKKAEKAHKTPLDEIRIQQQLQKCGDTIFTVAHIQMDVEKNSILPIKELNELRRSVLQKLYEVRTQAPKQRTYGNYQRNVNCSELSGLFVSATTKEQLEAALAMEVTQIFASPSLYKQIKIEVPSIGYQGKRVMKEAYPDCPVLFAEHSGIQCSNGIADHFVNITNSYAAAFLFSHGVKGIVLSAECSKEQENACKKAFYARYGNQGSFLSYGYGQEELMVMEYCPVNYCEKDNDKKNCALCKGSRSYFLEDLNHHRFPLYGDEDCRMHILDEQASEDFTGSAPIYLSFHLENRETTKKVIERAKAALSYKEKDHT